MKWRMTAGFISMTCWLTALIVFQFVWIPGASAAAAANDGPPFPRLGMWWLDPYEASIEDMARYDLLLDDFDDEELQTRLAQVRTRNPDILVFKPLSPSERELFIEDEDGDEVPNPEIKDLPSSFFLLQVGSTLTEAIDEEETEIYVAEMYYPNGDPRFHIDGEVAIGEKESARVEDIDFQNKSLTVERGYVRDAAAHSAGERIASHIRFWPGSWVMNVTAECPRIQVPGMSAPVNWIEYFFNLASGNYEGIYDDEWQNYNYIAPANYYTGVVIDRFEDKESWLSWNDYGEEVQIDLQQNNFAVSNVTFDHSWRQGTERLYTLLKQRFPGMAIIRNNPLSTNRYTYDGQVFESGGWDQPSTGWWQALFTRTDTDDYYRNSCYLDWFYGGWDSAYALNSPDTANAPDTPYVLMEVYEDEGSPDADSDDEYNNPFDAPGFEPNYQRMRFALGSTLLGDGYFSYEINTEGHGSLGLMWFDEYDNAGQGQGYLGYPLGPCDRLENGIYRRSFEGGLVLVNPQNQAIDVLLEQSYRKIRGLQAPEINDGALVDHVLLPGFDAIILLNAGPGPFAAGFAE